MITSKTIKYGQLLDWQKEKGVIATSVKAHFFNEKGVLVGRDYKFVPYDELTAHNGKTMWEMSRLCKPFGKLRQWFYETKCKVTTVLIRATQPV
jgi:hypothetical protein